MAQKRMFNVNIINSAKFLKMPIDAQNLYFHLNLRADDDGVVEAFTVMRQIGSSEDNLKVLEAKGFIVMLNEDLVTFITHWREHNSLRADRKTDSIYKELLIQMIPDIELLEVKDRSDLKPKGKLLLDGQRTDNGRTVDSPMTDNGPHSIVEYSIDKYSIGKVRLDEQDSPKLSTENEDSEFNKEKIITFNNKEFVFKHGLINDLTLTEFYEKKMKKPIQKEHLPRMNQLVNKYGDINVALALDEVDRKQMRNLSYLEITLQDWEKNKQIESSI